MDISVQNFKIQQKNLNVSKNKKTHTTPSFGDARNTQNYSRAALVDRNHNQILVKRSNLSFKGDFPAMPKNFALQNVISSVLPVFKKDDIILIGKDLKEAATLLKKAALSKQSPLKAVLKKVFFIADPKMEGALAIQQNEREGLKEIVNLNHEKTILHSQNRDYFVNEHQNAYVTEDDDIDTKNFSFSVKENKTNISLDETRQKNVREFNFEDKDEAAIKNINAKHFESMIPPDAGTPIAGAKKLRFTDIGGQDEAIKEIKKSILYPIKHPEAYKGRILNRGIILEGPPGTGKSLLAKALANEADAHFIGINGLEMESKWVGESEENWRKLFNEAKENSPSIIFVDEFDAVGKKREGSTQSRYDDKVVNQLLTLMSDVEKGEYGNTFVVVTTNKAEMLDDAIIRSGRFGKNVHMDAPKTTKDVKQIFDIHTGSKPLSDKIDKDALAEKLLKAKTTGADIAAIAEEAHQNAFERTGINEKLENDTFVESDLDDLKIEPEDFDKAIDAFQKKGKTNPKEGRVLGFHKPGDPDYIIDRNKKGE